MTLTVTKAEQDPELDWIRAAKAGDRQAFYLLYQKYHRRVYAVALRLLQDKAKAEDACQEVFVKVWQQLSWFRGDSSFATWLHSISTRTAVDLWRKDRESRRSTDEMPEIAIEAPADTSDLDALIQRLPDQARAVFVLFALEGFQHNEIAALLGIAEGSSKSQYHRARQLLRGWLDENRTAAG